MARSGPCWSIQILRSSPASSPENATLCSLTVALNENVFFATLPSLIGEVTSLRVKVPISTSPLTVRSRAMAERAVFLEKGQVRFEGNARDLLERDDLARAVFLGGEGG